MDGGWATCGLSAEIIARAAEAISPSAWRARPARITLPDAPAPTAKNLEKLYYPDVATVVDAARTLTTR